MRAHYGLLILVLALVPSAEAKYFLSTALARYRVDYENVRVGNLPENVSGDIELVGVGGGWTTLAPGFGYEAQLQFLGTNSRKLNPDPEWGTTWYYRLIGKGSYMLPYGGVFGFVGGDLLGSFLQSAESHYFGPGAFIGAGFKFKERYTLSVSNPNSSILFSPDSKRVLRGLILEFTYDF